MKPAFYKVICGVAGACLLVLILNTFVSYPEGYVVPRKDCAGLTKEMHYYDEQNTAYDNYKKMGSFQDGDEVEYFSGNIVKMEKIRDDISGMLFGFLIGYVLSREIGIIIDQKKHSGDADRVK